MPKTKKRKRTSNRAAAEKNGTLQTQVRREATASAARRPVGTGSLQNIIFSGMVALGCLGMAIFFIFFYGEDANHYLYAGIIGLTGLGWLALVWRRWSQYRSRV